eukprot:TRINITY_DN4953_c0_g2_i1.p1 TRINITY_DN4953_c0_g2~~TRINITY_DN4953_c0_g2_i1.p1  ORF type:complete len:333 (-),score=47.68 TRINITY_DN4953_c0_g2_i1:126-1124(-)
MQCNQIFCKRPGFSNQFRKFSLVQGKKENIKKVKMENSLQMYQADAFTETKFGGNPAAVCLLESGLDDQTMQKIAAEMNLAETCYLEKVEGTKDFVHGDKFKLRWFTPTVEVPLCGHATLASGAVLIQMVGNVNKKITFSTLSGDLTVEKVDKKTEKGSPLYRMVLPMADPVADVPLGITVNHTLIKATVGDTSLVKEIAFDKSLQYLLVVLKSGVTQEELESIKPDVSLMLKSVDISVIRAVCVTCQGQDGVDVLSRFFSPWCGIDEDPVTGSAHSILSPYWSKILGKSTLTARQCSVRQGNLVMTSVSEDKLVMIDGSCAFVMKAQIFVE